MTDHNREALIAELRRERVDEAEKTIENEGAGT